MYGEPCTIQLARGRRRRVEGLRAARSYDEYYAFLSGGYSGQITVYGLPSGRLLKIISGVSQFAEDGYGYNEETKPLFETTYGSRSPPLASSLGDFHHWEYEYGHDLDLAHAIIKVPGMTYEPPLIGSKQLLNFTASCWPTTGATLIAIAVRCYSVLLRRRRATLEPST